MLVKLPLFSANAEAGSTLQALNTALLGDGVLIEIDAGVQLREPLHLVMLATGQELLRGPRVLVRAERNSELRVIEEYLSLDATSGLTNSVCEVNLASGATKVLTGSFRPGIVSGYTIRARSFVLL